MRNPKRIKLITDVLYRLWNKPENQDLRLGQLLYGLSMKYNGREDLFYTEDTEWLEFIIEECNKETC